jgi:hypothetical protein
MTRYGDAGSLGVSTHPCPLPTPDGNAAIDRLAEQFLSCDPRGRRSIQERELRAAVAKHRDACPAYRAAANEVGEIVADMAAKLCEGETS